LDALAIAEDDARAHAVTQTGGLPYHGGPGSNYMTHSIAAMVEALRADPGAHGLVSGVGMHMQKHAYGVLSADPGTGVVADAAPYEAAEVPRPIVASPEGAATVAAYSVLHGRDGAPERALLVCDVANAGSRCYAQLEGGPDALVQTEAEELVGRTVRLRPEGGLNLAHLD